MNVYTVGWILLVAGLGFGAALIVWYVMGEIDSFDEEDDPYGDPYDPRR